MPPPDADIARLPEDATTARRAPVRRLRDALVRTAADVAGRGRLLILTYHRVLPAPDPMLADDVDVRTFAWQMEVLRSQFRVLPLSEGIARLRAGALPTRAAAITFDDGYRNNFELALPVLRRHGLPATFFVATGFLDGGRMWNDGIIESVRGTSRTELDLDALALGRWSTRTVQDRKAAASGLVDLLRYREPGEREQLVARISEAAGTLLPGDLMMSSAQVAELARVGMELGAHTVTHPILARTTPDIAAREIRVGRARLEELTGRRVTTFAYPNGRPNRDYGAAHVAMVAEAGFDAAVTTAWGAASARSHPLQLPRVAPWERTPLGYSLRLLSSYFETPESVALPGG